MTRVIDLLYGETATGSAADVLAERHLPVAARRFPRAYPLEPGLWRNLLDDDRSYMVNERTPKAPNQVRGWPVRVLHTGVRKE